MKFYLIFFWAITSVLISTSAQQKTLEKFISSDFRELSLEQLKNNWLSSKQEYGELSGSGTIAFTGPLKNIDCQVFYSAAQDKTIKAISLSIGKTYNEKYDYSAWRKINFHAYTAFIKALGKPHEFHIKEKLNFEAAWKKNGYFININPGIKNSLVNTGQCEISINRKKFIHDYSEDYFLTDKTMQTFKNLLYKDLQNIKASNQQGIKTVVDKINLIQKNNHILDSPIRAFYRKNDSGAENSLNLMELKLTTDVLHDAAEKKPAEDGSYIFWIYQNGFLRESGELQIVDGKDIEKPERFRYFYDEQNLLRSILSKSINDSHSYWVEYDENGYLSRVTHFKNNTLEGTYLYYGSEFYSKLVVTYFDKNNDIKKAEIKSGEFYFRGGLSLWPCFSNNWFYPKNRSLIKKFKMSAPTPNHSKDFSVKPSLFFNTKDLLSKELSKFEDYCKSISIFREWIKQEWTKNVLNPKVLFTDYTHLIAHVEKASEQLFPIAVVQIGKGAIKVIDQNKQYSVYKLNQLVLDRYQLKSISPTSVTLLDLKTKKEFNLEKGKALKLGKGTIITINGEKHQVQNGDNFLGHKISIKDNGQIFINDKKIDSEWHFFPQKDINQSIHKLADCNCYTKKDRVLKIEAPVKEENPLFPNPRVESEFSLDYYSQNCFMYLDIYKLKTDPTMGKYVDIDSAHALYNLENNKLVKSKLSRHQPGQKSYHLIKRGNFLYIDGRKVSLLKLKYNQQAYGVKISLNTFVIIRFAPKNFKALKTLISKCKMKVVKKGSDTYLFKDKYRHFYVDALKKYQREDFSFSLNEIKSEIIINDATCSVTFANFETTVKFPNGDTYIISTDDRLSPFG